MGDTISREEHEKYLKEVEERNNLKMKINEERQREAQKAEEAQLKTFQELTKKFEESQKENMRLRESSEKKFKEYVEKMENERIAKRKRRSRKEKKTNR